MVLSPDFKEFIALLNTHSVRFLVVGGYAVAFHGHPRYTKDLDIWIDNEQENADRLMRVLDAFGFGSVGLAAQDFLTPHRTIQLGYPPNRIDLLTSMKAVDFAACYTAKVTTELEGVTVDFIDLANLKRNKRAVGRHEDLADLDNLE